MAATAEQLKRGKVDCEILKCADCGRIVVSIYELRLSNHKCSGRWIVVNRELIDSETLHRLASMLPSDGTVWKDGQPIKSCP